MKTMKMKETEKDSVKARFSDILLLVSWGDISIEYFGKSGVWLYHMLDGVDDNKQPAEFSV